MNVSVRGSAIVLGLLACATPARAQDEHKAGVTMGAPSAIGVIFQASDRVAVRPEISFSHRTSESSAINISSSTIGFNVSALVYMRNADRLKTYVSPRLEYSRVSGSVTSDVLATTLLTDTDSHAWGGAGSFGAQFALNDRFSVFGEAGLGFSRSTTPSAPASQTKGTAWGTRTAVGVIFFP
jgi:opacity protein-like surface antigen